VARLPGFGVTMIGPNTVAFVADACIGQRRKQPVSGPPLAPPTVSLAAQVALDETLLGIMRNPPRYPRPDDYARVGEELRQAHALYSSKGWIEHPQAYHLEPDVPTLTQWRAGAARGLHYEHIEWTSSYQPHSGEPGAGRWDAFDANHRAHAWLVRAPRPTTSWLICLHGFGMGMPFSDFHAFRAKKLARELGLNLAFPILPLHGPRKQGWMSGADFMSFELMHPVFAVSQAVSDTRALVSWLQRSEGATSFGLYGLSLGSHVASLLAGVDDRFSLAIAGIPVTDLLALFSHHSPPDLRRQALELGALGEHATLVHRVISPLAFAPRVPHAGRFIFGALGDRMATAGQAQLLWEHWGRPQIEWLRSGHIVAVISPAADRFVTEALAGSRLLSGSPGRVVDAAV
jgi:hypothetical protein